MADQPEAHEPLECGLRRLALIGIDDALTELDAARDSDATVHALRKHCKRMRALIRMFEPGLARSVRLERRRYRDLGRELSAVRDSKVALDVHDELIERYGALLDPSVGAEVRQSLIAAMQADGANGAVLDRDRIRASLLEARRKVGTLVLENHDEGVLRGSLRKSYRRGRSALRCAAAAADPTALHRWRKEVKQLWYQLELIAALGFSSSELVAKRVAELGELLGKAQDAVVYAAAIERAAAARSPVAVELLSALASNRRRGFERRALALGREVYAEKPKRLASEALRRSG